MSGQPKCRTCKFWDGWRRSGYGESACRRHAPMAIERAPGSGGPQVLARFPNAVATDWCGDHELAALADLEFGWLLPGQDNHAQMLSEQAQ